MNKKRWLWVVVVVVLVAIGGYFFGNKEVLMSRASLPPVTVKAMVVKTQSTPLTLDFIGQIQAFHEVEIRPQVAGFIVEKFVDGGQTV